MSPAQPSADVKAPRQAARPDPTPAPGAAAAARPRRALRRQSVVERALSAFPAHAAARLIDAGQHRCWANGTLVMRRGLVVPEIAVLVRGRLRMAARFENGHEVFFRWHMPGEIAGMISAVSGLPLPVDAISFDDCETLMIPRDALLQLMRADAEVACVVAQLAAGHAYDVVNLVSARTEPTLTARVLGVLRHLALVNGQPHGDDAREATISQQDIAGAVGASRQRVNLELKALERAGHILVGYRRVVVFARAGVESWPVHDDGL